MLWLLRQDKKGQDREGQGRTGLDRTGLNRKGHATKTRKKHRKLRTRYDRSFDRTG